MTDSIQHSEDALAGASREEIMSMLFANMVIQQTNMAMMLLGKVAHPESGEFIRDVDAAKMFIDQLAMLEAKTKGNLSKQEEQLMKQALAELRMAFVEAVDNSADHGTQPPARPAPEIEHPAQAATAPAAPETKAGPTAPEAPAPDESRKKFSKKY
jgi:hypothetical protein